MISNMFEGVNNSNSQGKVFLQPLAFGLLKANFGDIRRSFVDKIIHAETQNILRRDDLKAISHRFDTRVGNLPEGIIKKAQEEYNLTIKTKEDVLQALFGLGFNHKVTNAKEILEDIIRKVEAAKTLNLESKHATNHSPVIQVIADSVQNLEQDYGNTFSPNEILAQVPSEIRAQYPTLSTINEVLNMEDATGFELADSLEIRDVLSLCISDLTLQDFNYRVQLLKNNYPNFPADLCNYLDKEVNSVPGVFDNPNDTSTGLPTMSDMDIDIIQTFRCKDKPEDIKTVAELINYIWTPKSGTQGQVDLNKLKQ